jgi:hypothetical protein
MDSVVCGNHFGRLAICQVPAPARPDRVPAQRRPTNPDRGPVGTPRHHADHDRSTHRPAPYRARAGFPDSGRRRCCGRKLRACAGSSVVFEPASGSPRADRRRWPHPPSRSRRACGGRAGGRLAAVPGDLSWWNGIRHPRQRPHHRCVPAARRQLEIRRSGHPAQRVRGHSSTPTVSTAAVAVRFGLPAAPATLVCRVQRSVSSVGPANDPFALPPEAGRPRKWAIQRRRLLLPIRQRRYCLSWRMPRASYCLSWRMPRAFFPGSMIQAAQAKPMSAMPSSVFSPGMS